MLDVIARSRQDELRAAQVKIDKRREWDQLHALDKLEAAVRRARSRLSRTSSPLRLPG